MKIVTNILFFIMVLTCNTITAQNFTIYHKQKDNNINTPDIYENILLDEYQILSRDITMMDMAYSAIIPGYIHFKAKEKKTGYTLVASRLIGYSGLAINYINMNNKNITLHNLLDDGFTNDTDKTIFISSIAIIITTYLYDWIHGKNKLEQKQEIIRYKYGIKMKMNNQPHDNTNNKIIPSLSISYSF